VALFPFRALSAEKPPPDERYLARASAFTVSARESTDRPPDRDRRLSRSHSADFPSGPSTRALAPQSGDRVPSPRDPAS